MCEVSSRRVLLVALAVLAALVIVPLAFWLAP